LTETQVNDDLPRSQVTGTGKVPVTEERGSPQMNTNEPTKPRITHHITRTTVVFDGLTEM
jgi:hypothetical protein